MGLSPMRLLPTGGFFCPFDIRLATVVGMCVTDKQKLKELSQALFPPPGDWPVSSGDICF